MTGWCVPAGFRQNIPTSHSGCARWLRESQNWPQHLHNCAYRATTWLQNQNGQLAPQVPSAVLAAGRQSREQYYAARLGSMERSECAALAGLVRGVGKDAALSRTEVERALSAHWTDEQASARFEELLRKGVIAQNADRGVHHPCPVHARLAGTGICPGAVADAAVTRKPLKRFGAGNGLGVTGVAGV